MGPGGLSPAQCPRVGRNVRRSARAALLSPAASPAGPERSLLELKDHGWGFRAPQLEANCSGLGMEASPFSPGCIEEIAAVQSCSPAPAQLPVCTHRPTVPSGTIGCPKLERARMDH